MEAEAPTVMVRLVELREGYAVIESEFGTWKVKEDDWWSTVEDARYIGGDIYFVYDADIVRWALIYGYNIDEDLARAVAKAVLEGADSIPYARAWLTLTLYVINNKLDYRPDGDEDEDSSFEEAEEFIRRWVAGEVSLF
ncbi:MAG: hypothetical protein ACP5I3_11780 [Thermoproteus sp.]